MKISDMEQSQIFQGKVAELQAFWGNRNVQWSLDRALLHMQYASRIE